jgi:hypothetical protein
MSKSEEYEGLRTITQTLRRMSNSVGAVILAEASYELETVLLNDNSERTKELLTDYIFHLTELAEHLEILLKNTEGTKMAKDSEGKSSFLNYDFSKTKESIKRTSDYLGRKII